MRKYFLISLLCFVALCNLSAQEIFDPSRPKEKIKTPYTFSMQYRVEVSYAQNFHFSRNDTYPQMYLHGGQAGITFDFMLPYRFSLQTGAFYRLTYGTYEQLWPWMSIEDMVTPTDQTKPSTHNNIVTHRLMEHQLTIPVRAYYSVHLWSPKKEELKDKELNLFFFSGPELQIGLSAYDNLKADLTDDTRTWLMGQKVPCEPYERYKNELYRLNVLWGIGGGIEYDRYRLQAGYDFGLNNLVKTQQVKKQNMREWSWFVSFAIRFK